MENKYLESLAYKFVLGTATKEEAQLLHLWYDAEDMERPVYVCTAKGEDEYTTGKRLFKKIQASGGGKR
ncbi:hypothetical protein ACSBL2_04805 [Pedobacter sp. AW31-3R]|uniref:hypothetical protein n=1 Tax=Pedobacter sp. AW31-3R TaxID=3445781 RepID=UPI003FA1392B